MEPSGGVETLAGAADAPGRRTVDFATPEPGQTGESGEAFEPGCRVGRYELVEAIEAGGMGVVYKALDPQLGRTVALKLLHPDVSQSEVAAVARSRLLREAQAMARLTHPNVVPVHDVGTVGHQVFIAMAFIEGGTLGRWLRQRRHWRDIVSKFVEAGRGLQAAHARGLIHRDFKPENVLIGTDGRAMVTDFGLAREVDGPVSTAGDAVESPRLLAGTVTRTGALVGTPGYMAPEQLSGGVVDERADQFAFCVSLHLALFGKHPFTIDNDPTRVSEAILAGTPATVVQNSTVPGGLSRLLRRGLEIDPAERFGSMSEVLAALEQHVAQPPARGRRGVLLSVIAAVAIAGAGVLAALGRPSESSETPSRSEPRPDAPAERPPLLPREPMSPASASPTEVTIALSSTPSGARVIRVADGKEIGVTPVLDAVTKGEDDVLYELRLDGWRTTRVTVRPEADVAEHVALDRRRPAPRPKGTPIGGQSPQSKPPSPVNPWQDGKRTPQPDRASEQPKTPRPDPTPAKVDKVDIGDSSANPYESDGTANPYENGAR